MPVYTINTCSRPTKTVISGGDFKKVAPVGPDFSMHGDFARLDDGTLIQRSPFQQGFPVTSDLLPKHIQWGHGELKKGILDFEKCHTVYVASENFRRAVESLEPGIHQFVPVEIGWKGGGPSIPHYWLYPCRRIDSIHDSLSTYEYKERQKTWHHRADGKLVFDLAKIGDAHMWLDRGNITTDGIMISQALKNAFEERGVTGIQYFEREAA